MLTEMTKYLKLNNISAYKKSLSLSNSIWNKVVKWKHFEKSTIGSQYTRAVDSISANIAEGFGRHFKKDKINFYRFAKGSIMESLDWTEKSKQRKLINNEEYDKTLTSLKDLIREINYLIKFTSTKLKS